MNSASTGKNIIVAFGTRPEATKMAPVVTALRAQPGLNVSILVTGQHREQLSSALNVFGLTPDADLDVMVDRQTLAELSARIIPQAAAQLRAMRADMVLVHGDTTTTFCLAYAAFLEGIPVAHVEAGLRSFNLAEPFPEEANRRLTSVLSALHFAPTALSRAHLLQEHVPASSVVVTGQTAVDAVRQVAARSALRPEWQALRADGRELITLTMHRRENLPVMGDLARVIGDVCRAHPGYHVVYPVHLNPAVRDAVTPALADLPNVTLTDPLAYDEMAALMSASALLLTDSGGLQEEGAALGVPVAVLRNVTERPEGVDAGVITLLGTAPAQVGDGLRGLLSGHGTGRARLADMRGRPNPYGDGQASARVAQAVAWFFGLASRPAEWQ
ncbi:non-hydrolyzing UDP-N-acetylglucosamine 2-epimerase [Deinococcus soli (ex Cha et al. 2016)]|uniref:non-hydrolyzing UDP-N-acetylglucosamine 2-epimerase n=1 Tax=Deinococcus soli (ex Cha et al. 2016) TaxID=1309411 RepID=UPI00286B157A|nr:UDP-N-acetylglucosamine 2-epimerase (non-hydrolyzing) [Deinococcus soli (ex Cha et al. 2016)]